MPSTAQIHTPRRAHSRLRLNIPAKLVTTDGPTGITLVNLSQGGARIHLHGAGRIYGGVLKWMDREVPVESVWQAGPEIGLRFSTPIEWDWVVATRHWQPARVETGDESRSFARKWAKGVEQAESEEEMYLRARRNAPGLDLNSLRQSGARGRTVRSAVVFLLGSASVGLILGWHFGVI